MGTRRIFRAVTGVGADGPPPGVLRCTMECQHHVLFAVPAQVDVNLAGWVADLLVGTVRSCNQCRFEREQERGAIPLAVDQEETTRRDLPR